MAVKLSLDNILLLEVYSFEGSSNWHKNDGMARTIIQIPYSGKRWREKTLTNLAN